MRALATAVGPIFLAVFTFGCDAPGSSNGGVPGKGDSPTTLSVKATVEHDGDPCVTEGSLACGVDPVEPSRQVALSCSSNNYVWLFDCPACRIVDVQTRMVAGHPVSMRDFRCGS
jgi:hypothetical protein